jgi:asparagine synthase (glutamine-hydrolysing)
MCGVAGILYLDGTPVSPVDIKLMTDAIAHRGPDGEGQWAEGSIGLGHRRLAIIDLSPAGAQPMVCTDQRYVVSFNGEIYNFKELRAQLQALGYKFRSQTDTEVILYAFAVWGTQAISRLNGMFAFAIWDRKERVLTLARDRYGIKPLYYAQQDNFFAFGSEQKALFALSFFRKSLNRPALLEYFTFQNILTDQTFMRDIFMLPAGHLAQIDMKRSSPSLLMTRYWDYHFRGPTEKLSDEAYREELDHLFQQAVKRQLMTDVELGCYLSGGMDSGSITAIAASQYPYVKTFTCGFDLHSASGIELSYDERARAELMSYKLKTEHYEMVLKAGDMERCMDQLVWHLEEPRVGQSYPNFYAAKLASKFVKVVLSGAGGDELFGGYPWRYYRAVINDNFIDYANKYYKFWQRLIPNSILQKIFQPIWKDVGHVSTQSFFCDVFKTHSNELRTSEDYINHSLYFEAKTFLHGLLVVEDKLSMAHSLESRVPFLDNDLVDFAMTCPVHLKLNNLSDVVRINENDPGNKAHNYFAKTSDGKQILRDVMQRYIPQDIVRAEKQGFSAPDASWFKGESIEYVKRTLFDKNARLYDYMERKEIERLVNEHLDGQENRRLLIWSLLNFETLLKQHEGIA